LAIIRPKHKEANKKSTKAPKQIRKEKNWIFMEKIFSISQSEIRPKL